MYLSSLHVKSSNNVNRTNVSHTPERVGTVEKVEYRYLPYGYGRDVSSGSTAESLQYLINRFGAIASFSGTYDAGRWVLDIQRENGSSNSELCLWQLSVKATNLRKVIS